MKRTVRLATLPLNKGKYDELRAVIEHYSDAKRFFVAYLRQVSLWRLLDRNKSFRDYVLRDGQADHGDDIGNEHLP